MSQARPFDHFQYPNLFPNFSGQVGFFHTRSPAEIETAIESTISNVQLINGCPCGPIEMENVYFIPGYNCLYDCYGIRIPESCIRRGSGPEMLVKAGPETITIPSQCHTLREPMLFFSEISSHWGHFLTEGIARLWARNNLSNLQRVRYFTTAPNNQPRVIRDYLGAIGMSSADFVHVSHPVKLERCFIPGASFSNLYQAYSIHLESSSKVGAAFRTRRNTDSSAAPVFFSRTKLSLVRKIQGELELEDSLAAQGVRVIYPEELSLEEQVYLFGSHKTFIGCWGSAFHGLCLGQSHEKITTHIFCTGTPPANYLMFDALLGNSANYVQAMSAKQIKYQGNLIDEYTIDVEAALNYLQSAGCLSKAAAPVPRVRPRDKWAGEMSHDALIRIAHKMLNEAPAGALPDEVKQSLLLPKLSTLLDAGTILLKNGHLDAVEPMYRALAGWPGLPPGPSIGLAKLLTARGELEAAAGAWRNCISRYPDEVNQFWFTELARCEQALGHLPEAEQQLRHCLKKLPTSPTAAVQLANLLFSQGRYDECRVVWEAVIHDCPESAQPGWLKSLATALLSSGHKEQAEKVLDELVVCFPDTPLAMERRAEVATAKEDWGLALNIWTACADKHADNLSPRWLNERARASFRLGQIDPALKAWHDLISRFPDFIPAYTHLAAAAEELSDWRTAGQCFTDLINRFPQNARPEWYMGQARVLQHENQREAAARIFDEMQIRFPQSPLAFRAKISLSLDAQPDTNSILPSIEAAVQRFPKDKALLLQYIKALCACDRPAEATKIVQQLEALGDDHFALVGRWSLLRHLHDDAALEQTCSEAMSRIWSLEQGLMLYNFMKTLRSEWTKLYVYQFLSGLHERFPGRVAIIVALARAANEQRHDEQAQMLIQSLPMTLRTRLALKSHG